MGENEDEDARYSTMHKLVFRRSKDTKENAENIGLDGKRELIWNREHRKKKEKEKKNAKRHLFFSLLSQCKRIRNGRRARIANLAPRLRIQLRWKQRERHWLKRAYAIFFFFFLSFYAGGNHGNRIERQHTHASAKTHTF